MVGINPGALRHKVSFFEKQRVSDGAGGFEADPVDVLKFSTLADVKAAKSLQTIEAGKMVLIQPYHLFMRQAQNHEVKPDMIVEYKGKRFTIQGIEPADELGRMLKVVIVRG